MNSHQNLSDKKIEQVAKRCMGPLNILYFSLRLILKGMFWKVLFSFKGLQTPSEIGGKEVTSFKVESNLKEGCTERKALKVRGRRMETVYTGLFGVSLFKCLSVSYQRWMLTRRSAQHFLK